MSAPKKPFGWLLDRFNRLDGCWIDSIVWMVVGQIQSFGWLLDGFNRLDGRWIDSTVRSLIDKFNQ